MKSLELLPLVRIVGTILYFFIAAQAAFYHFGFGKALYGIPAEHFIGLRRAVDPVVRVRFKVLYIAAIAMMILWFLKADKTSGFTAYAPVLFALLLLAADMILILKFSEPLNALINSDFLRTQDAFEEVRKSWLDYIFIRGYLSISGFILLIFHLVFRSE